MDMGIKLLDLVIEYQASISERFDSEDDDYFNTREPGLIAMEFETAIKQLQQT